VPSVTTLITGATGLIGSTLTKQLLDAGATDLRIVHRPSSSFDLLGDAAQHVERVVGDLLDARSLARAMENVDRVYHVAALLDAEGDADTLYRVNVDGTAHVVNAALRAGVQRLAHVSSIAALGVPETDAIIDETSSQPPARDTPYARSKYQAELEVQRGIAEGLDAVIVNPSLVFGTGRPGTNTRRIVDAVRTGWMPGVPAGSTNVVDVKDVAAGLRRAMAQGATGERHILGSENLSWHAIVRTLADAFGVEPPTRTIPPALLTTAGALAEGAAWLTRQPPRFTRSLARAASSDRRYTNQKAIDTLGCSFRPFAETARRIACDLQPAPHAAAD